MPNPAELRAERQSLRLLKRLGVGLLAFVALFLGVLLLLGSSTSLLRGPIAHVVSGRLKRPVTIDRIEEVQLFSLHPHGVFVGVTVGNPPWAHEAGTPSPAGASSASASRASPSPADASPASTSRASPSPASASSSAAAANHFVHIGRIAIEMSALPLLLRGVLVLPHADAQSVDIRLLRDASNRANWRIGSSDGRALPDSAARLPVVQSLAVKNAHVELDDEFRNLKATGTASADGPASTADRSASTASTNRAASTGTSAAPPGAGAAPNWLRIRATGQTTGTPFAITAVGQPVESMRTGRPYQLTVNIVNDGTKYQGEVTFAPPFELDTVAIDFSARGPNLADIYNLTHVKLPNTGDYQLSGHLKREHDLLTADLSSKSLDLASASASPTGKPTSPTQSASPTGKPTSPTQTASSAGGPASKGPDDAPFFPRTQLNPENLRKMHSRIHYHADTVRTRKLTLKNLDFQLDAQHGVMKIEPASFQLAQGRVTGKLSIDASKDNPDVSLDAHVADLNLAEFHPKNGPPPVEGKLFGRAVLRGHGRSAHEVAETSDGSVTVVVPHGEIRQAFAELAGSDIVKGLGLMIAKDQGKTDVRCGVAQFRAFKGTLVSQSLVFDTDDVLITGKGEVDLGSEIWDLSLNGAPKKVRLFRVRAPIEVRGPLLKPSFNMKTGNSLGQGAAALGLAALLTPVAAILPFVDPGLAKNADCSALITEARQTGQDADHNR
ncbi:MAG TPA: AsmA family protein [Steroidobacteraceae bacterium]|jgi:hypothetical protein